MTAAMSGNDFQTIVVGAGSIGSATAYWLAERGQTDVLVLEQFELDHHNGASNDHSRIIRHSYHNSTYGRLTAPAYANWERLRSASGMQVVTVTGGLDIAVQGTPGVESVENYRRTLTENGHSFDVLDTAGLVERFPQWSIDQDVTATYQADSGIVDIRRAVQTHVAMAEAKGVAFKEHTPVRRLESIDGGVRVHTDDAAYTADKVVVSTASWSDSLLAPLGATWATTISQEQVAYLVPRDLPDFTIGRFPLWVWHGEVMYYGFPVYGETAIKVSRDVTGNFVTHATRTMEPIVEETALLTRFVEQHLPGGFRRELYSKTCVYDMPPDRDFIIDSLPGHPDIVLGLGAGHAAKFSGLFGEIVSELVVDGRSTHPIDAFGATRPALTDPSYEAHFVLKG
ncbi:N-methyl-L-tryptophan oxidase [Nocardioides zeae]